MMFGIDSLYVWLAVIIISVAVEAFTLTLCGIWFAAGGVAALIAASLSVGLMGQWIVFIVFSALLLVLVRPLCRRLISFRCIACGAGSAAVFSAVGSRQPTQIVSSDRLPLLPNRLTMFWRPVR